MKKTLPFLLAGVLGCSKATPAGDAPTPSSSQAAPTTKPDVPMAAAANAAPSASAASPTAAVDACKTGDGAACDRACGAGDKPSCLKLGQIRLKNDDDEVRSTAVDPLKKACDGGVGRACAELGGSLFKIRTKEIGALKLMKDKAAQQAIKEEQAALQTKGCELNDGLACASLSGWYAEGYGVAKDAGNAAALAKKAVGLFEKECNEGETSSCTGLGYLYIGGKNGVAKDKAKAVKLFKKACDAKDELGCTGLKEFGGGG